MMNAYRRIYTKEMILDFIIFFCFLKTFIKYLQMSHTTANQCVLRYKKKFKVKK